MYNFIVSDPDLRVNCKWLGLLNCDYQFSFFILLIHTRLARVCVCVCACCTFSRSVEQEWGLVDVIVSNFRFVAAEKLKFTAWLEFVCAMRLLMLPICLVSHGCNGIHRIANFNHVKFIVQLN